MIPLKDDNPTRTTAVVNILLVLANAAVFLYQVSLGPRAGQQLVFQMGLVPAHFSMLFSGQVPITIPNLEAVFSPLVTSMFLHGGWLHLLGNMLFLWIFGDNIEDYFGHVKYFVFYFVCGIGAGLTHTFFNWDSTVPSIGASGAISGVMGAYIVLYPRAQVLTLVPLLFFFFTVRLPAMVILGYWFLIQFLSGIGTLGMRDAGGVAVWAHVGGFVIGALITVVARASRGSPT